MPPEIPSLSVPREHGQLIVCPPLDELSQAARGSRLDASDRVSSTDFFGMSFGDLRGRARQSALRLAAFYTGQYRSVSSSILNGAAEISQRPIIMGGHQPELFHCGVWFKNFLLSRAAQSSAGTAIHILIDNDWCRSTAIKVPIQSSSGWSLQSVAYDHPRPATPWESCYLQDISCWNSFSERILKILPPLQQPPLIEPLWHYARQHAEPGQPLAKLLSLSRHLMEQEFGLNTLEVPLSQLVSTDEFGWFSMWLLAQLPQLHGSYNRHLHLYRQNHKIRNHAQPLPDLGRTDDWLEGPWWCHPAGTSRRDPLWVRVSQSKIDLSNRQDWQWSIATPLNQDSALQQWQEIAARGMHLRPRALLTTMYARLILSDLFIHGTGGARYDQLTDCLVEEIFGIPSPPVGLATATLHLPLSGLTSQQTHPVESTLIQMQQKMRTAKSNPEAILESNEALISGKDVESNARQHSELRSLLDQKRSLLAHIPPRGEKWQWHSDLQMVNRRLKELTEPKLRALENQIQNLQNVQREQSILLSREFSFCLFPRETVLPIFSQISPD